MRSLASSLFVVAVVALVGGCDLYFSDDPPPCTAYPSGTGTDASPYNLRNPQTGLCELVGGGGGGGGCDNRCGPCTQTGYAELTIAIPDWGSCYSKCDALDESTCLATSGCQAAYDEYAPYADAPSMTAFKACWATAQSGPIQGGGCWNLGADDCARHDDCSMYYTGYGEAPPNALAPPPQFSRCAPEPTTIGCENVDCGYGSHCEEQCYPCASPGDPTCDPFCTPMCVPDTQACTNALCGPGYECVEVCDTMQPTPGGPLPPGQCYATCVPTGGGDPGSCTSDVLCDALPPACPANTVPGITNGCWSGYCIPEADCGPKDPGTCEQAVCAIAAPACPANTVPGVKNGCYTGYCIPQHACAPVACETLTTEVACDARAECTSVYSGGDCTCYPGGCTCEELTFARCETWGVMPF